MSRAELIYPLKKKIESEISKINSDKYNSAILTRYYRVRFGQVASATLYNELNRLNKMSAILGKKYEDATTQDIENLVFEVDKRCKHPSTSNRHWKILKTFYRWMRGGQGSEYPPEVKWIKMKQVPPLSVTEKDLISYDECIRITEKATNLRDKALFQCKLDAGCRMGEILTVQVGEVELNDIGAVLQSDGKTGKAPLILTWSAKTLAMWLNIHPFRDNPSAPLWPLLDRDKPMQMSYAAAYQVFRKCVKRSGIKKRVWPHLLKHVSCSYDSEIGLPESYRKYKHHWTPGSKMARVYEHLSSSIIPKIQAESMKLMNHPIDESKIRKIELKTELSRKCNRCEFENARDSIYCNRCAFPLKEREQFEKSLEQARLETVINKIRDSPEKLERIISILG
ncbi:MAG: tyrosine-type recombinase/integrase [Nitrosarchaeum sp.]